MSLPRPAASGEAQVKIGPNWEESKGFLYQLGKDLDLNHGVLLSTPDSAREDAYGVMAYDTGTTSDFTDTSAFLVSPVRGEQQTEFKVFTKFRDGPMHVESRQKGEKKWNLADKNAVIPVGYLDALKDIQRQLDEEKVAKTIGRGALRKAS